VISQAEPAAASTAPTRRDALAVIARRLADEDFGTGPRAELRRLNPRGPLAEPALQRLLARHVPEAWLRGDGITRWALLIHSMALAAPDGLRSDRRLGAALFEAGWKEGRLVKLLNASGEELIDALPRAVRFLVAKGQSLNAVELADLIWQTDQAEGARQRIAREYYRAEARAARTT
jgi:CRISPR type I-E-associated protein CasB/Cse2